MASRSKNPSAFPAKGLMPQWMSALVLVFTLLGAAVLFYYGYHIWAVLTDNVGTLHLTADVVDLDNDGDLDVVRHRVRREEEFTAFAGSHMWFNQGNGEFAALEAEQGSHGGGWASAPGDFDGDGDLDLLLYLGYQLRLRVNQGGAQGGQLGQFSRATAVGPTNTRAQFGSVLAGDVDGDGQTDAVVAGCCSRTFTVDEEISLPNYSFVWRYQGGADGRGALTTPIADLEGLPVRAGALGDLDGDGDLDLFAGVIAPSQSPNDDPADRVLLNDGLGAFADSGQRLGQTDSNAVVLGDLHGDGDLDVLVGDDHGVTIWINQSGAQDGQEGNFIVSPHMLRGGPVTALFLSDLDDDGDLDALVGQSRRATIWWNDGQATFSRSDQRFGYDREGAPAVGDFNGDARPDIFAGSQRGAYRIWFNQGDGTFRSNPPVGQ